MIWRLYDLGIFLFGIGTKLVALWNPRIRKWNLDRKQSWRQAKNPETTQKSIWIHCASLGEYDQARPLIAALRRHHPHAFITLSFFSPSGYESKKKAEHVDQVIYLPLDRKPDMEQLVLLLKPDLFVGVKYEFWHRLIQVLDHKGVPMIWISVKFKKQHFLDRSWAAPLRENLRKIKYWFCQDASTHQRLHQWGISSSMITGDTRLESILEKRASFPAQSSPMHMPVFVYASVYLREKSLINATIKAFPQARHIIVPHKVDPEHILNWKKSLPAETQIWHEQIPPDSQEIYLVDTIGKLFKIYSEATAVYVGGGFGKGVHNTLEPASCLIPIAIGPKHDGFLETEILTGNGAFTIVHDDSEAVQFFQRSQDQEFRAEVKGKLQQYFEYSTGATEKIGQYLIDHRMI